MRKFIQGLLIYAKKFQNCSNLEHATVLVTAHRPNMRTVWVLLLLSALLLGKFYLPFLCIVSFLFSQEIFNGLWCYAQQIHQADEEVKSIINAPILDQLSMTF